MTNINVEIKSEYKEKIDLLKKIIPNKQGGEIEADGEMLELLVDEFLAFVQAQAAAEQEQAEGGCCGGGSCGSHDESHDHKHEGGCCSK